MKKIILTVALIVSILLVTSCLAGPNPSAVSRTVEDKPAGFFQGLWHGFILLFSFIISLFSNKVSIYEVYNIGGWYNFGFLLGVMIFFSGSGGATRKRRK